MSDLPDYPWTLYVFCVLAILANLFALLTLITCGSIIIKAIRKKPFEKSLRQLVKDASFAVLCTIPTTPQAVLYIAKNASEETRADMFEALLIASRHVELVRVMSLTPPTTITGHANATPWVVGVLVSVTLVMATYFTTRKSDKANADTPSSPPPPPPPQAQQESQPGPEMPSQSFAPVEAGQQPPSATSSEREGEHRVFVSSPSGEVW